jgi:23S rRNA (cytidine1920-2'-O)/16S rRNA (cytidine1409-2'-O)-methyltransferase
MKSRLDAEMARRGIAPTAEAARRMIMAGVVRVNSRPAGKPDARVDSDTPIAIVRGDRVWASRGALKLIAALAHFEIDVTGARAIDVGASTGGFTDVLLARGAASVIAIDVGYGQLAEKLRTDRRVTVMDRTNIRTVKPSDLPCVPNLAVIDTSFISLRTVLPAVVSLCAPNSEIVALIKPQFEVRRSLIGKGGVVSDDAARAAAVESILEFSRGLALEVRGVIESPIKGAAGNVEYLTAMKIAGRRAARESAP